MSEKVFKVGEDVKLIKEGGTSVFTVEGMTLIGGEAKKASGVSEPKDSIDLATTKPWALWGDNDSWPQDVMSDLDKLGVAKSALNLNSDLHYGTGIQWMKEKTDEEAGTLKHIVSNPAKWRRYSNLSGFNKALSSAINSTDTFGLGFIRVVMAGDGSVLKCECLDTPSCRLAKRDSKGRIKKVYYGQDIHLKAGKDDFVVEYDLYDGGDIVKYAEKHSVFVFPIRNMTWGRFYYGEPDYYATFRNGWADIAKAVPALIKSIYKNQASLKYHIKVPISLFYIKYKNWLAMEQDEQLRLIKEYRDEVEKVISDAEAAGKSVVSFFDDVQKFESVSIEPIKNELNAVKDLPNNVAANSEILFAIGIDPSLLGLNMPGGKDLNGGGGSQRRESLKIKQATLTRERLLSLEFAWAISILNKYDEDIYPMYIDIDVSQTLDENPTGKKTVVGA